MNESREAEIKRLQTANESLSNSTTIFANNLNQAEAEIKRLREALEKIRDHLFDITYCEVDDISIMELIIKKALKENE